MSISFLVCLSPGIIYRNRVNNSYWVTDNFATNFTFPIRYVIVLPSRPSNFPCRESEMRITAAILMIASGIAGVIAWPMFFQSQGWLGFHRFGLFMLHEAFFLLGFMSMMGGIYTLMRKPRGWVLAGAICSLIIPIFGIPALIILAKR